VEAERDEVTRGEVRGLSVSQSDATAGEYEAEETGEPKAGSRASDRALAVVLWNYLGTNDAALVRAWFDKLQQVAKAQGTHLNFEIVDGPITWESVS
jgi:hypothetical protein